MEQKQNKASTYKSIPLRSGILPTKKVINCCIFHHTLAINYGHIVGGLLKLNPCKEMNLVIKGNASFY